MLDLLGEPAGEALALGGLAAVVEAPAGDDEEGGDGGGAGGDEAAVLGEALAQAVHGAGGAREDGLAVEGSDPEVVAERARRVVARRAILLEALEDDGLEVGRDIGVEAARGARLEGREVVEDLHDVGAWDRHAPPVSRW